MIKLKNKIIVSFLIAITTLQPCFAMSNETKLIAKKFILAMIGVLISSILIYIGLALYNRFFHNPKVNDTTTFDDRSLDSPKNLDNSISNFLNRTKM